MPISDLYTGTGTSTLVSTTTATPLCSLIAPTTKRAWIVGVRVSVGATNEAAPANVLFQLFKITNAASVAGGTLTGSAPNDPSGPATPLATFAFAGGTAYTTAPTGTATCYWQQIIPASAGSSWEEFPPSGYEYCTGPAGTVAGIALWATLSASATSTILDYQVVWSE